MRTVENERIAIIAIKVKTEMPTQRCLPFVLCQTASDIVTVTYAEDTFKASTPTLDVTVMTQCLSPVFYLCDWQLANVSRVLTQRG